MNVRICMFLFRLLLFQLITQISTCLPLSAFLSVLFRNLFSSVIILLFFLFFFSFFSFSLFFPSTERKDTITPRKPSVWKSILQSCSLYFLWIRNWGKNKKKKSNVYSYLRFTILIFYSRVRCVSSIFFCLSSFPTFFLCW